MDSLWQDLRYSARALLKQPTFSAAAVLTLALGIGANTAIFSVCDAVLFKRLPYPQPERIVMLWEQVLREGTLGPVAPGNFVDWRAQNHSFERLAALNPFPDFILTGQGEPVRLVGAAVSLDFFPLLGTRITIGRGFLPDEDQPERNHVAILSHALWQHHFGSDPNILGKPLSLNDIPFTIVGVLPREFQFVSKASDFQARNQFDVWVPLALQSQRLQRGTHPLRVFGRLRAGVTLAEAQADLDVIAKNLERAYPGTNTDRGVRAVPVAEQIVTDVRTTLLTLFAAVGLVLLIACVNVASLLLSRATARQREMAVRLALGASRVRLGQQLVTESMLLALVGGLVGTGAAWLCLEAFVLQLPFDLPRAREVGLNTEVLVFSGAVSVIVGVVFGCVPLVPRLSASESLKESGHTVTRRHAGARSALVAGQIALACVLLIGAGLMSRSVSQLLRVSPGFRIEDILTAQLSVISSRYPSVRRIATFQRELLDRVRNLPGVESAGLAAYLPFGGTDNAWAPVIEGKPPLAPGEYIKYRPVTPGYFETLAIPLLQGRRFGGGDNQDAPLVAMINEAAAHAYWPNESAVGRRLQIDGPAWRTIVGVIGNIRHEGLDAETKPELYVPYAQVPYADRVMTLVVRTTGEPLGLANAVRGAVVEIDPGLPLYRVQTMEHVVDASVGQRRFRAVVLGSFALVALILASTGVYGVMSYLVSQRVREFGIRAALGATGNDLLRLVLGRSAVLIIGGVGVGLVSAVGLAPLVRNLLYGVTPHDVLTLASASVLLTAVGLLASYLPARRAASIDPVQALRSE